MGVPGAVAGKVRGHAAGGGRRALHRAGAQRHRRDRPGVGPHLLDLRLQAVAAGAPLLRAREPRRGHPRRDAVHGHDRRPHGRRGQQERPRAVERGGGRRPAGGRLHHYGGAAGGEGQNHRRPGGRRLRRARLHRRLRPEDRQGAVALQQRARPGRARTRELERRLVAPRRQRDLDHRFVRSRAEPDLLGHRQPWPRLHRRRSPGRQPL